MRKIHILCIAVMGVGHKQEVIDFDGGSQMALLSSYIKKKKKKRNSSSYMVSYPLLSRFLNIMILKKKEKSLIIDQNISISVYHIFSNKLNNAKLNICWVFEPSLMVLLDTW